MRKPCVLRLAWKAKTVPRLVLTVKKRILHLTHGSRVEIQRDFEGRDRVMARDALSERRSLLLDASDVDTLKGNLRP